MSEGKNIPKLRFGKNVPIQFVPLKEISSRITRVNDGGKHPIMMITSKNGFVLQSSKYSKFMAGKSLNSYTLLKRGELAYNKGSSSLARYGCTFELHEDSALIPKVYHSFSINDDYDKSFYALYLNSGKVNRQLKRVISSTARMDGLMNISYEDFSSIKVPLLSLGEQKKIVDLFSTVDNKISIQSQKIERLENLKRGFMQKIFSRELRFKDENGEEFGEWEEKTFGDVFSDLGYGLNASAKEYDGENKYIRITDIDERSGKYLMSEIVSPDCQLDDKYLVQKNDILFARTGASVGKSYLYNPADGKMYYAGFLIRGNVMSEYDSYFIYSQTLTEKYKKWVDITSMRSGQPGINAKEYASYVFDCPSLHEQRKIADFLSKFDGKIDIEKQILEKWQSVKKGLLQQMFV